MVIAEKYLWAYSCRRGIKCYQHSSVKVKFCIDGINLTQEFGQRCNRSATLGQFTSVNSEGNDWVKWDSILSVYRITTTTTTKYLCSKYCSTEIATTIPMKIVMQIKMYLKKKSKIYIDRCMSGRFLIQQDVEKNDSFLFQCCFSTHCGEWFKRTKHDCK